MILIRVMGGLGNQMFQYAFGKSLAIDRGVEAVLDAGLLDRQLIEAAGDTVREFDLDVFQLPERLATQQEVLRFNGDPSATLARRALHFVRRKAGLTHLYVQRAHEWDEDLLRRIPRDACVVGRWQSEKYFARHATEIRRLFDLRNFEPNEATSRLALTLEPDTDVALQVRRGDQVTHPVYRLSAGAYTADYYRAAMRLHREQGARRFLVFSDSMDWCREQFRNESDVHFVEQPDTKNGYVSDMWLLTRFRHFIISNSTFGWWGAWLGERAGSRIIAPSVWGRDSSTYEPPHLIPSRWTQLHAEFESLD